MEQITVHDEQLQYLKKIEGQVAGIQRMIEEKRYCVDILMQIRSAIGALRRVEGQIYKKHLDGCVAGALRGKSEEEKQKKINEVIELLEKFRNEEFSCMTGLDLYKIKLPKE
jgi:CsoR family transcriptional regulator, copper-sensing transcriptional repressor